MTVNIPGSGIEIKLDRVELKLDRVIDEMRFLKSHMIALDTRLRGIEAYLKPSEPSEPSEQQPDSKFTPWFAAAGRVGEARTPMALGRTPLPTAHDRPLAQDAEWWAQPVVMLDPMAR
jgi:hypothetical protein